MGRVSQTPDPSTNPDPSTTTGLDAGAGVPAGDTPPGEASVTAEYATTQTPPPTTRNWWFIGIGTVVGIFLLVIAIGVFTAF